MLDLVDRIQLVLAPLLAVGVVLVVLLLAGLVIRRAVDELRFRRRQRTIARYRPLVDALLAPAPRPDAVAALSRSPARDRPVIAAMLLGPLRVAAGDLVGRLREAARALDLIEDWKSALAHRRWWVRAEAARALGLLRESSAIRLLVGALDDEHEEVRAAAVGALGTIADPRTIPALLSRLSDQSRHQRARMIEALAAFGPASTPALLTYARTHPDDAELVADLLGMMGSPAAGDDLVAWAGSDRPGLRAAAFRALGTIGLDDRAYYYALRALDDPDPDVRAMAARALGRTRRQDAAAYLADRLGDEWVVAAHAATALRSLGGAGIAALETRANDQGQAGDLARQMVWERRVLAPSG